MVWKALLGIATASSLVKPACTFFPRDLLPSGDGWPSGLLSKSRAKGIGKDEKAALYAEALDHISELRRLLNSADGKLFACWLAQPSFSTPGTASMACRSIAPCD